MRRLVVVVTDDNAHFVFTRDAKVQIAIGIVVVGNLYPVPLASEYELLDSRSRPPEWLAELWQPDTAQLLLKIVP